MEFVKLKRLRLGLSLGLGLDLGLQMGTMIALTCTQNHMKKALITGITGQDGSYLAELLLSKGYEVHGIIRRCSTFNTDRIDHIYTDPHIPGTRMFLHYGDLADGVMLIKLLYEIKPDEIYHLGAQTHVRVSFDIPEYTGDVTGLGTLRILEAIRQNRLDLHIRENALRSKLQ